MARTSFEQTVVVAASADTVRTALATLTEHERLHPLIVSTQSLPDAIAPDGSVLRRYRIVDGVRMGPLRLRVTYRAELWVDASGAVVSDAFQSPGVRLHVVSRVTPLPPQASANEQTRVGETVTIDAPRLLLGYVRNQAQQAHRALFANLKSWLESEAAG